MGTLERKWGPFGDPKTEQGPHGDPGPQMETHLGAVLHPWGVTLYTSSFYTCLQNGPAQDSQTLGACTPAFCSESRLQSIIMLAKIQNKPLE